MDSDGCRSALSGVPCTLDAGVYTARFLTPAKVIVPDYCQNSPAISVRCTTPDQRASATIKAFNATTQQQVNNATGGGIIGAIIVDAVTAANADNDKDEFRYSALTVQLKKI
jgi:hypothetical protein